MAPASTGENPAARALSPYTSPNPLADAMIPRESWSSRRREASSSIGCAAIAETLTDVSAAKGYGSVPPGSRDRLPAATGGD
jgi:hypothetical protein